MCKKLSRQWGHWRLGRGYGGNNSEDLVCAAFGQHFLRIRLSCSAQKHQQDAKYETGYDHFELHFGEPARVIYLGSLCQLQFPFRARRSHWTGGFILRGTRGQYRGTDTRADTAVSREAQRRDRFRAKPQRAPNFAPALGQIGLGNPGPARVAEACCRC